MLNRVWPMALWMDSFTDKNNQMDLKFVLLSVKTTSTMRHLSMKMVKVISYAGNLVSLTRMQRQSKN